MCEIEIASVRPCNLLLFQATEQWRTERQQYQLPNNLVKQVSLSLQNIIYNRLRKMIDVKNLLN